MTAGTGAKSNGGKKIEEEKLLERKGCRKYYKASVTHNFFLGETFSRSGRDSCYWSQLMQGHYAILLALIN